MATVPCYFWTLRDGVGQRDFARVVECGPQPIHLFRAHIRPEFLEPDQILGVIRGFVAIQNGTNGIDVLGVVGKLRRNGRRRNGRRRLLPGARASRQAVESAWPAALPLLPCACLRDRRPGSP